MNGNPFQLNSSWRHRCTHIVLLAAMALIFASWSLSSAAFSEQPSTGVQAGTDEIYRPKVGEFPIFDNAHSYRGELVFVDHANRRGSLRVRGEGTYFRNPPHPFAMLPYGMIRYHGAPADLRDVPLGTVLYVRAYLPPDPSISSVPVLPVDNRNKTAGYSGQGIAPAENHVLLLEDEPSYCLREGLVWKLQEIELKPVDSIITAKRERQDVNDQDADAEKFTFDTATRVWRGRERLSINDLIAESTWPAQGKKLLDNQVVMLGITWRPTPDGIFTRFHLSDIWFDDVALKRASELQTELHKTFIRSRWMPAVVDDVEYGKFGRATVTLTLFGGMDESLYGDFKQGQSAMINAAENTLKHAGGNYGPAHMASKGQILDVVSSTGEVPMGSSGIQLRIETDLIIEGIRQGRVVRVRAAGWPQVDLPREEFLGDGSFGHEDRFPNAAIFPKY